MQIYINVGDKNYFCEFRREDYQQFIKLFQKQLPLFEDIARVDFTQQKIRVYSKENVSEVSFSKELLDAKESLLKIFNHKVLQKGTLSAQPLLSDSQFAKYKTLIHYFGNESESALLEIACQDPEISDPENLSLCQWLSLQTQKSSEKTPLLINWLEQSSLEERQILIPYLGLKSLSIKQNSYPLIESLFDEKLIAELQGEFGKFLTLYDRFEIEIDSIINIRTLSRRFKIEEFQFIYSYLGEKRTDVEPILKTFKKISTVKDSQRFTSLLKFFVKYDPDLKEDAKKSIAPIFMHWAENLPPNRRSLLWDIFQLDLFGFHSEDLLNVPATDLMDIETFFQNYSLSEIEQIINRTPEKKEEFIQNLLATKESLSFDQKLESALKLTDLGFNRNETLIFWEQETLNTQELFTLFKTDVHKNELIFLSKLTPEKFQKLLDFASNPTPWPATLFTVRQKELISLYSKSNDSQTKYGEQISHAIHIGCQLIADKQWSFEEILDFFAKERGSIAIRLGHPNHKNNAYGTKRTNPSTTQCDSVYAVLSKELYTLYKRHQISPLPGLKIDQAAYLKYETFIDTTPIILSTIELYPFDDQREVSPTNCLKIHHTHAQEVARIMQHVETLYRQALLEPNRQRCQELLGEIFWWICQAKPWELGDPSIAEMLIRSIWIARGYEPLPWKEGLVPWVEVMKEPDVTQFSTKFKDLFLNLYSTLA